MTNRPTAEKWTCVARQETWPPGLGVVYDGDIKHIAYIYAPWTAICGLFSSWNNIRSGSFCKSCLRTLDAITDSKCNYAIRRPLA